MVKRILKWVVVFLTFISYGISYENTKEDPCRACTKIENAYCDTDNICKCLPGFNNYPHCVHECDTKQLCPQNKKCFPQNFLQQKKKYRCIKKRVENLFEFYRKTGGSQIELIEGNNSEDKVKRYQCSTCSHVPHSYCQIPSNQVSACKCLPGWGVFPNCKLPCETNFECPNNQNCFMTSQPPYHVCTENRFNSLLEYVNEKMKNETLLEQTKENEKILNAHKTKAEIVRNIHKTNDTSETETTANVFSETKTSVKKTNSSVVESNTNFIKNKDITDSNTHINKHKNIIDSNTHINKNKNVIESNASEAESSSSKFTSNTLIDDSNKTNKSTFKPTSQTPTENHTWKTDSENHTGKTNSENHAGKTGSTHRSAGNNRETARPTTSTTRRTSNDLKERTRGANKKGSEGKHGAATIKNVVIAPVDATTKHKGKDIVAPEDATTKGTDVRTTGTNEPWWLWGLVGGMGLFVIVLTCAFCFIYSRKAKSPPVQPPATPPPTPRPSVDEDPIVPIIISYPDQKKPTAYHDKKPPIDHPAEKPSDNYPPPAYSEQDPMKSEKVVPSAPYIEETNQPLNGTAESSSCSQGGANSFVSPGHNTGFSCYEAGSPYGGVAENESRGYGGSLLGNFAVTSCDSVGVGTVSCPLTSFGYHEGGRKTTSF